jgi:hypothetical protein
MHNRVKFHYFSAKAKFSLECPSVALNAGMIFGLVHFISILEFNSFWHIAWNTSVCFGLANQLLVKTILLCPWWLEIMF